MHSKQLLEQALNVQHPWFIEKIDFDEPKKRLYIYVNFNKGAEFFYESKKENIKGQFKAYDTTTKRWRHLNFFEHECYLHARVPRVKIDEKKVRVINPPCAGLSRGFTLFFEAFIIQLASNMPVNVVSKLIKESNDKIWLLLGHYRTKALEDSDYSDVKIVGMDETSKKKGHDYITLFVDLLKQKTIFIAEGKDNKTIKQFKDDLKEHNGSTNNITDVSCDMSPAFIKGVKEYLPQAKITFDKFHIIKIINEAVDEVRKKEVKEQEILRGKKASLPLNLFRKAKIPCIYHIFILS